MSIFCYEVLHSVQEAEAEAEVLFHQQHTLHSLVAVIHNNDAVKEASARQDISPIQMVVLHE